MDEFLLAAYRRTAYRVRLTQGGWCSIVIEQRLPTPLAEWIGPRRWGFITAWNPGSRRLPRSRNRYAQQQLLQALRALPETLAIRAAMGVGAKDWKEPSLFVIGPDTKQLDLLAQRFGQNAYLHGRGETSAQLRIVPPVGA